MSISSAKNLKGLSIFLNGHEFFSLIKPSATFMINAFFIFLTVAVDTYFLSQLGPKYVAAGSIAFSIYMILTHVSIGISIGASSRISYYIGMKNYDKVSGVATSGIALGIIFAVLSSIFAFVAAHVGVYYTSFTDDVRILVHQYNDIICLGSIITGSYILSSFMLRSMGYFFYTMIAMITASVLNIIMDYLLIFGNCGFPKLEMTGSALATIISQCIVLAANIFMMYKKSILKNSCNISEIVKNWSEIAKIGIPNILSGTMIPLSTLLISIIASRISIETVAAATLCLRMESLILSPQMALSSTIGIFVASNHGAMKYKRISRCVNFNSIASLLFGIFLLVISIAFADSMFLGLSKNYNVAYQGSQIFVISSIGYGFFGVASNISSFGNGMSLPLTSITITALRSLILNCLFCYILSFYIGFYSIAVSKLVSNVLVGIGAFVWYKIYFKRFLTKTN